MEREKNRPGFRAENLLKAQARGWEGLRQLQAAIRVGMTEEEARREGERILKELGAKKHWHRVLVRFGANTLKKFNEASDAVEPLREGDVYFLDLGPVFEVDGIEYEADIGETFVVESASPQAPEHQVAKLELVEAARTIFRRVAGIWREESLSGAALYARAKEETEKLGYVLNPEVDGHRVGDFPHQVFFRGGMGEIDFKPSAGVWILEIQIRHPHLPFGAFIEDLLV